MNTNDSSPVPESGPARPANEPNQGRPPLRKALSRIIDVVLWLAVVGVLVLALVPKSSGPLVDQPATPLSLPLVEQVGTKEYVVNAGKRERPLLLKAFASWCGACRRDSGILNGLEEARLAGKLDVLSISVDKSPNHALAAKKAWPIAGDVAHDKSGQFSRDYKIDVLPTYVLIGTDGQVKRVTAGTAGAPDIRAWLGK